MHFQSEGEFNKDLYTKNKIYWGKKETITLKNGKRYTYRTTLIVDMDRGYIEVEDFDEGLSLCSFCVPICILDNLNESDDLDFDRRVNSVLWDISYSLQPHREIITSVFLYDRGYRKHKKREFLKIFDEITSKLMDLYNTYIDI